MEHLLISWLAYKNDFHRQKGHTQFNPQGPTLQFHEHFFRAGGYGRHLLLYSSADQRKDAVQLAGEIGEQYGHSVEPVLLEITDVIDLNEVRSRVERWLQQYKEHELTLFFSPGTSAMQLAWYLVHLQGLLRTQLVQTRAAHLSATGQPELLAIAVEQSTTPVTVMLREQRLLLPEESTLTTYFLGDALTTVYERARKVAQADGVIVLIRGESGTGKEHLAHYVHEQSARSQKPFLSINCAALTEQTLESRLFGHKKGAFTGADRDAKGLFAEANGGTIFLDEIGDISSTLQMTLLRVLQNGEIQPLNGRPYRVDVRVVAATNAPLEERCRAGLFRWDLFYRLAVAELELPPLRLRPRPDRERLLDWLLAHKSRQLRHAPIHLAAATRRLLLDYAFPGNVRELESLVESLLVFSEPDTLVQPADLPVRIVENTTIQPVNIPVLLDDAIRAHIAHTLEQCDGVKLRAAKLLGVDERTVRKYAPDKPI